jgi:hypothetical protein
MASSDEFEHDEYSGFETSEDDEDLTIPCPHCGEEVYEEALRCPACGEYVTERGRIFTRKPVWVFVGVAVSALIVLFWIVSGF